MTKAHELRRGPVLTHFPLSDELAEEFSKFRSLLATAKKILISSTLTSDGDSIGSQLGIYYLIEALRKGDMPGVTIINESPVPLRYQFLSKTSEIKTVRGWQSSGNSVDFDLGIVTDGGIERTGTAADFFKDIKQNVLVDHHVVGTSMNYAAKLLETNSSSTCEIVYNLFEAYGLAVPKEAAEHIYAGIVFDTGFFKHSLTTPRTHYVASELLKTGIDFSDICNRAILSRTWGGQVLLRRMLDHMEISDDKKIVHSYWSHEDLSSIDFADGDQEGMINQMYYTDSAKAVALFVENKPGRVKVSFRSKGEVNVAEFARSLTPDGGGHVRAAGCSLEGELESIRKDVIAKLQAKV